MKIVADENILFVREAFETLGDVIVLPGREISNEVLRDADLLLVRTVTKVNEKLLAGTSVRMVASATAGEDHIDRRLLHDAAIAYAYAPGSNAVSVAEYVIQSMLIVAGQRGMTLEGRRLGVVGAGHVGSHVYTMARALGMECVLNDPPLQRETGDARYRPIEEIHACDVVSLHVSLNRDGEDKTVHLVNEEFLSKLQPRTLLVNTARGEVVNSKALPYWKQQSDLRFILDVWEHEPNVDPRVIALADFATPHVAGYGFDGKVRGTEMIYRAVCDAFGRAPDFDFDALKPPPDRSELLLDGNAPSERTLSDALTSVYRLNDDGARFREMLSLPENERAAYFDQLRRDYPIRREWSNTRVRVEPPNDQLASKMRGLGFSLA